MYICNFFSMSTKVFKSFEEALINIEDIEEEEHNAYIKNGAGTVQNGLLNIITFILSIFTCPRLYTFICTMLSISYVVAPLNITKIRWEHKGSSNSPSLHFQGRPFVVGGHVRYNCSRGKDQNKKAKAAYQLSKQQEQVMITWAIINSLFLPAECFLVK